MNIIIVTGVSGAGKSQAANTLEDNGYHCVDNMPVGLLNQFCELYSQTNETIKNTAFVIDIRGEIELSSLMDEICKLEEAGNSCRLIFLDCDDAVIVNRYKESRRSHPLSVKYELTIQDALRREREILSALKKKAHVVIDTTKTPLAHLKQKVRMVAYESDGAKEKNIFVTFTSFGFKYGIPPESDTLFDSRLLPNPYYVAELKEQTGLDAPVRDFVFSFDKTREFVEKTSGMLDFIIPMCVEEGRTQLNISIGCTGGKHRSVAIAEVLGKHAAVKGYRTLVLHRDINN